MAYPRKVSEDPQIRILDGTWSHYTFDEIDGPLTQARWITRPGREEFILRGKSKDGPWSLQLQRKHDEFAGDWVYDGATARCSVVMHLYRAAYGEDEWILLGTWTEPGAEPAHWSIRLWPDDPDDP